MQVLKKDYVAAGLCCIQLYLNSSNQEQALRHLEHAKVCCPIFIHPSK
jgi:zinc finger FYVE domain-containing protein 26